MVLLPKYDPLDPALMDDPYPVYARLREVPLCRGGPGQWVATRYSDVVSLLRDSRLGNHFPEAYRRFTFGNTEASSFFERILLNRDPPDHTRLRRLMGAAFTPTFIRKLEVHIGELVDDLIRPLLDSGVCDAVSDLAFPLPILVVCELLGIPASDRGEVRPYASDLCKAFTMHVPAEDRLAVDRALCWLRGYVGRLLDERTAAGSDDLISVMRAATQGSLNEEDALSREEIVDNAVFLLFAGFETTMNLITTGCAALASRPDQFVRLRNHAALVPLAVEEFLRFDAPIQTVGRLARESIDVGGRTIRAGRVLLLLLGSANRDERIFENPDDLNVARSPNPHLSFSIGTHFCLGAALARLEAAVLFGKLRERFARLEHAAPPVRLPSATFRSYASLPLALAAA